MPSHSPGSPRRAPPLLGACLACPPALRGPAMDCSLEKQKACSGAHAGPAEVLPTFHVLRGKASRASPRWVLYARASVRYTDPGARTCSCEQGTRPQQRTDCCSVSCRPTLTPRGQPGLSQAAVPPASAGQKRGAGRPHSDPPPTQLARQAGVRPWGWKLRSTEGGQGPGPTTCRALLPLTL